MGGRELPPDHLEMSDGRLEAAENYSPCSQVDRVSRASGDRSRGWCFTLNNYTPADELLLADYTPSTLVYLVYGKEIGDSGTPHLQGFVYFKNPVRFATLRKLLARAHWERARGSPQANFDYCTKQDESPYVFGVLPMSPSEKGLLEKDRWKIVVDLAQGGDLEEIAMFEPQIYVQHYSTLKRIKVDFHQKIGDLDAPCGLWIWGPPGSGKSFGVRKQFGDSLYMKNQNKWWCGYKDEEYVLIDDFDTTALGHHLKIWADAYAFTAEIKGSSILIRPKGIIITSNYSIEALFNGDSMLRDALLRRFRVVYKENFVEGECPNYGDIFGSQ